MRRLRSARRTRPFGRDRLAAALRQQTVWRPAGNVNVKAVVPPRGFPLIRARRFAKRTSLVRFPFRTARGGPQGENHDDDPDQRHARRPRPQRRPPGPSRSPPPSAQALLHRLLGEPACRQLGIYPIPDGFKLSVVIPVYNEERWIREVVRRVQAVPIPKEIVIVEDCSTDGTRAILKELEAECDDLRVFYQPHNQGKGAALREGFRQRDRRRGDRAGRRPGIRPGRVPAADPADPRRQGRRGVRLALHRRQPPRAVLLALVANKVLTLLSNMFTNLNLTDMETCYKVFRREVLAGHHAQVEPLRLRAGDHGQDRPQAQAGVAHLRDADQLLRPHLRGGQEDRPQGRVQRLLLHPAVPVLRLKDGAYHCGGKKLKKRHKRPRASPTRMRSGSSSRSGTKALR